MQRAYCTLGNVIVPPRCMPTSPVAQTPLIAIIMKTIINYALLKATANAGLKKLTESVSTCEHRLNRIFKANVRNAPNQLFARAQRKPQAMKSLFSASTLQIPTKCLHHVATVAVIRLTRCRLLYNLRQDSKDRADPTERSFCWDQTSLLSGSFYGLFEARLYNRTARDKEGKG